MSDTPKKVAKAAAARAARKLVQYVPPQIRSLKVPLMAPPSGVCGPASCGPQGCAPPGPPPGRGRP